MKVKGTYHIDADPKRVWEGLMSPELLARCVPGCQQMEQTGDRAYAVKLKAGIGAVSGIYTGTVRIYDIERAAVVQDVGRREARRLVGLGNGAHHLRSRKRRHAAGRGGRGEGNGHHRPRGSEAHR